MSAESATRKGNWIQLATIQYIKHFHPEVWEEARRAARERWTAEHPEDPWKPKSPAQPIQWEEDA